jgi:beta-galactosidase/beta-glucuronidase
MREFYFDTISRRAMLNGKPYYMRGTNVCIYRFFEDPSRNGLPWDKEWVRKLHETFKSMHWNSIRYCIGFPPEIWYEVADETGFLIQDEFPVWYLSDKEKLAPDLKARHLAAEYRDWMEERWNHPCVVIWDAQNETYTEETGLAIGMVRNLDLSGRPWDNGWSPPQSGLSIPA